jgi:hypothetical protein
VDSEIVMMCHESQGGHAKSDPVEMRALDLAILERLRGGIPRFGRPMVKTALEIVTSQSRSFSLCKTGAIPGHRYHMVSLSDWS